MHEFRIYPKHPTETLTFLYPEYVFPASEIPSGCAAVQFGGTIAKVNELFKASNVYSIREILESIYTSEKFSHFHIQDITILLKKKRSGTKMLVLGTMFNVEGKKVNRTLGAIDAKGNPYVPESIYKFNALVGGSLTDYEEFFAHPSIPSGMFELLSDTLPRPIQEAPASTE